MRILGIETSCDETSLALLNLNRGKLKIESIIISSQTKLHARLGGVVPELAARRHNETIVPLLHDALNQAKVKPSQIDLMAVTSGPGLITALQVGVETAKTLAAAWHKPLLGINHIEGHLVSPFLSPTNWPLVSKASTWPAVALVISGGHTELYLMRSLGQRKFLGKTLDDAAGEAFDKVAKMLKLPYPGGPQVAKLALQGNKQAFTFPRPLLKNNDYNFSFSGLKTAVLYTLQKYQTAQITTKLKADICASFQQASLDVLINKTLRAAKQYKARSIIVSGGVSANQALRQELTKQVKIDMPNVKLFFPELSFTGDNAAMIALAAAIKIKNFKPNKLIKSWQKLQANANWELWN
jgi:N6-L-threonylcarbamoyladenine synthase